MEDNTCDKCKKVHEPNKMCFYNAFQVCFECDVMMDLRTGEYNSNKYDRIVCGDCGVKSHCFCDDCGEFVPTSECIVRDLVTDGFEETKVLCNECNTERILKQSGEGK
tara:strand:- start:651 stop:974 length:324 start_codon:yes stop_codon:yes gene_type:complete